MFHWSLVNSSHGLGLSTYQITKKKKNQTTTTTNKPPATIISTTKQNKNKTHPLVSNCHHDYNNKTFLWQTRCNEAKEM